MEINLDSGYLLASVLWSGISSGYLIYGWKQKRVPALVGGIVLGLIPWFVTSPIWMSVVSVALMVGIYYWSKKSE